MTLADRVYVMDRQKHYKAIVQGIDWETFCVTWEKGNSYQLDFTVYVTNSYGYSLLTNENILEFQGQQYVIKTYNPQYADGYNTLTISATHIGYECQYCFQAATKAGDVSMSITDAMHWLFDGNVKGFSWEVKGNFSNRTLTDFGNCDAKTGLSTIQQAWGCDVTFDNTHVIVWEHGQYLHKTNQTIRYEHDTDQIALTSDSTGIVNKVYCVGAQDDNNKPKFFQPFWSWDQDSINRWGEKVGAVYSNDKVNNRGAMDAAAKATMQLNPSFSIQVTYYGTDFPEFGSQVYLEVLPMDVKEWVEVTGYKIYPFAPEQAGEIDLNSLKPNILSINRSLQNIVGEAVARAVAGTPVGSTGAANNTQSNQYTLTNGTVNVEKNSNAVTIDCRLTDVVVGKLMTFDQSYRPSTDKTGSVIVSGMVNNIVSWRVAKDGTFEITAITDIEGKAVTTAIPLVLLNISYLI